MRKWIVANRGALMLAAVLAMLALGLVALHGLLSQVHLRDIRAAFHRIEDGRLILALLLTGISYGALTLYDFIALRVIGRPLPWRTAALASFCSYTLSHNLGLSLLTGGSARYRIYTAAGLGGGDVARVIALASLCFWSGVFMMAGLAMMVHPTPILLGALHVPIAMQRMAGGGIVALMLAGLLLMGRGRPLPGLFGWHFMLPSRGQMVAQIGVACIDLAAASAALYVLVPGTDATLYPAFFLGYALAIIAALVSHVPGGVGIFEAVMIATLPHIDRSGLLAALIAYRAIYYLIPLLLGVAAVALHEGNSWRHPVGRVLQGAHTALSGLAPVMLAISVAGGGVLLLISGALPGVPDRLRVVDDLLPLAMVELSHLAASIIGTLLILLAAGLYRRLDAAFWATRLLLVAGALFSLSKGLDYEEATILLLIAALLQWARGAFYRRTRFSAELLTPGWLATLSVAVGLSIWIGFFAYKHVEYQNELWWNFALKGDASRFLRAELASAAIVAAAAFWRLFRPATPAHLLGKEVPRPSAEALHLADRTDAFLALTGDKRFLLSSTGRAFLMYQIQGHSWIVMGDPVGDRREWADLLWRLREMADAGQGRLLLYQLTLEALPLAIDMGLRIIKYGEDARVDLARFTLEGQDAKQLRYVDRRAAREGLTFAIIDAAAVPDHLTELEAVSRGWLDARGQTEKAFSIGRFDNAYMRAFDCAVVRREGRIIAFANIWKTANHNEVSVDLMRHSEEAPPGTMDFLFLRLMLWGREQGYVWFALGMAPLSGIEARRLSPFWAKAQTLLYRYGESLYGFEGLRAYKEKFLPQWEPRFIAGPQGVAMARAMLDLQKLVSGSSASAAARTLKQGGQVMAG